MGIRRKKFEIGPDTILQRNSNSIFNQVDGEIVMLSLERNEYYGMNKVGSMIWKLLEDPCNLNELVTNLVQRYNVSEEQCVKETLDFIKKLMDKNLIKIV